MLSLACTTGVGNVTVSLTPAVNSTPTVSSNVNSDWSYLLVGGASPTYGVLEITYNGSTGYACTYEVAFNASDLHHVCDVILGLG